MRADLYQWQRSLRVPSDQQLGEFTVSMIGGMDEAAKTQGILHGGCLLKTKAAETGHLMRFALHELAQHGDEIPCKEELRVAGVALERGADAATR